MQTIYLFNIVLLVTTSVHKSSSSQCSNLAPGVNRLRRGIDITKLSFLPSDNTNDGNGFKRSVIDFTCLSNKLWSKTDGQVYQTPDQIEIIDSLPGGLQHPVANFSKYTGQIYSHFLTHEADLLPYWELSLSKSMTSFVDKFLPISYEANPSAFHECIEQFGTHFLVKAYFGGVFKINYFFANELRNKLSDNEILKNAHDTFFNSLKLIGGTTGSQVEISKEFRQYSESVELYYGGSTNLVSPGQWLQWSQTVPNNPWLFSGKLEPITNLMPMGPKRDGLIKAIGIYLDRTYLNDLSRLAHNYLLQGNRGSEKLKQYINQIDTMAKQAIPDHNSLINLGNELMSYITIPDWFYRTKLCYEWYADGSDVDQCSGPSKSLCAQVNSKTQWYRDDTDIRDGGCRMKWGLTADTGAPDWFNELQICFRWHPDGDSGQCGGGAPAETCAPIGNFTDVYRDDTDIRPGGCQMSWRLLLPNDSPGWLLNTRLCFDWFPDGDIGQCSAPSRNLCAIANEWTDYYRDDTDRRPGGCQMSWSIQV
ncbi:perivitellin-2 67 kDa subunit-like [Oppia nitens]|uniref:perivitellin-2 67 kDa subunit-like n=1 Tax=Oppia nitens TaxID=1686743 RepID=UPI0023DA4231|nr:perivitellin-2 67 kDa subunit-like [Oppia nitens]